MEPLESLEIYIPEEAEVKSILLWSLPNPVLRRMGLPLSDAESSGTLAESPKGIWISPVVLRRKGQKRTSPTGNSIIGNMSSVIGRMSQATPGPYPMSFVSSCNTAFKVLKDTVTGKTVPALTSHISKFPPASAPQTYQDAVVIYHGRVYLSIRKPRRSQRHQQTDEPQSGSLSSITSTSEHLSSQASLEPADEEIKRKRQHLILPQMDSNQPKDLLTKPDRSTVDQELLHDDNLRKKHTKRKATHSKDRKDAIHKGRDVSSSMTAHSVPQSTDSVDSVRGKQAADGVSGLEEAWILPQGDVTNDDNEIEELGGEEAESTNHNNESESDDIVGVVEQSNNQSWTRRGSQGAASTSLQQKADYKELEQEEEIARLKAKLRRSDAALNSLHSSEQQ